MRRKLGTLIRDVRTTSGAVDSAATDINSGIDRLSTRTSDQAASLEEAASSMEERIREGGQHRPVARPVVAPALVPSTKPVHVASAKPVVTRAPQPLKKAAGSDVEWQEF